MIYILLIQLPRELTLDEKKTNCLESDIETNSLYNWCGYTHKNTTQKSQMRNLYTVKHYITRSFVLAL